MSLSHEIVLKGSGMQREANAAAAVSPGDLIVTTAAGTFQRHAVADGKIPKLFAIYNYVVGRDLNKDYAATEWMQAVVAHPGMEINATVAPGAAAIARGDMLESAGDGTLRKHVVADSVDPSLVDIIGQAMEAIDNSAGATKVRVRTLII